MSHLLLSEDGQEKEELNMMSPMQEDISITSMTPKTLDNLNHLNILSMPESLQTNNNQTLTDKSNSLPNITLTMSSSLISEVESTLKGEAFKPFWTNSSKEISEKLWLPIQTDFQDLDSSSLSGCLVNLMQNSHTSIKKTNQLNQRCYLTSWKSLQSLQPDTTVVGNTKMLKIRMIPSTPQKLLFNKCFQAYRFFYNKAIHEINRRYHEKLHYFRNLNHCILCSNPKHDNTFLCEKHQKNKIPWKLEITLPSIRKAIMKSDKEIKAENDPKNMWQLEIPYDTRQLAIKDAIGAYTSALSLKSKGLNNGFEMKYKCRKSPTHVFSIDSDAIDTNYQIFKRRLKKDATLRFRKHDNNKLPTQGVTKDSKIMKDHGKFYILIPIDATHIETKLPNEKIISLDPGIRTFQTGYDPNGKVFNIGDKTTLKLQEYYDKIDMLKGVITTSTKRRKSRNIRHRIRLLLKKVNDIVRNLHNQVSVALTKEYENILLPEFCTSKMLKGKKLHSSVNRLMSSLSFYRFKEKMKYEASKRKRNLYIVREEYTSKTCTRCGDLNQTLGSNKVFTCNKCNLVIDRDINGARNIMIKNTSVLGA